VSARFIWQRSPDEIGGYLENIARERALTLAKQIFYGVVARTPVYTGSARASWMAGFDRASSMRIVHGDSGSPLGPPTFPLKSIPKGRKIVIYNNTPYIVKLEYGWSSQAPQGMVRVTLASLGVQLGSGVGR